MTDNYNRKSSIEPTGTEGKVAVSLDAPESQICKTLYDWWVSHKQDRDMPSRADLHPRDLISILPYVYMVDVLDEGAEYVIRLQGSALAEMMGVDCTGMRLKRNEESGKFDNAWRGEVAEPSNWIVTF